MQDRTDQHDIWKFMPCTLLHSSQAIPRCISSTWVHCKQKRPRTQHSIGMINCACCIDLQGVARCCVSQTHSESNVRVFTACVVLIYTAQQSGHPSCINSIYLQGVACCCDRGACPLISHPPLTPAHQHQTQEDLRLHCMAMPLCNTPFHGRHWR